MEARSIEVLKEPVPLDSRVPTGIEGLDQLIEGGFPKNSLILLAGQPGTGKTIFSMQFLCKGAEDYGENGVYVSFAESEDVLAHNVSKHLEYDLKKAAEGCGKVKVLDLTTVKEEGISTILELILDEVRSLKAERLVIDSFTAMAQAFKEKIDARIILHTVLGKIVRHMGCTTILIAEVPIGQEKIGTSIEEFVADGVFFLRQGELQGRRIREIEISKLRGTRIQTHHHLFTLDRGFNVVPYRLKLPTHPRLYTPTPDTDQCYSTGSKDLDNVTSGYEKGKTVIFEVGENIPMPAYDPVTNAAICNFLNNGNGALFLPVTGVDATQKRHLFDGYVDPKVDGESFWVIQYAKESKLEPYMIRVEGRSLLEDWQTISEVARRFRQQTGRPFLYMIGWDMLENTYGKAPLQKFLSDFTINVRINKDLGIIIAKPGLSYIERLRYVCDIHLVLVEHKGSVVLYGVKPRTSAYFLDVDVTNGNRRPILIPIM
jgi:KaiC/GvpD/RAD55 family RecA-like ATPase